MQRRPGWTLLLLVTAAAPMLLPSGARAVDWEAAADEAVERLQAYVRVASVNPPGNETPAAALVHGWLTAEGIDARLYDPMNDRQRQALVARIPGDSGRTLVLMSHSDVVPAVAAEWTHPPFAAEIADGLMYGRGTADTKGLGILQVMTMLLLHRQGLAPRDEILLLLEPDEESGAGGGMVGMLEKHPELFRNVRLALNEGGSGAVDLLAPGQVIFFVQAAEKGVAWMKLTARGEAGHGSMPRPNNAVAAMARALDRIAAYETPLRPAPAVVALFHTLADRQPFPSSFVMRHVENPVVRALFHTQLTERPIINSIIRTTISLTGVHGGYKTNVIPAEVEATLDCRVTLGDSGEALRRELERVVDDPRITIELLTNGTANESPLDERLLGIVADATQRAVPDSLVAPIMSSGATDSLYFRRRNVPAYGFNPIVLTEAELGAIHGIDERIPIDRFRAAVRIYYDVVAALAGVGGPSDVPAAP